MRSKHFVILASLIITGIIVFCLINYFGQVQPNTIIFITMDTTRADHLSCYGYGLKTTPNIDALAKNSLFFENAFSPVPMTLPSHSSMFTGLIPPTHGVHYNLGSALPESQLTLTEILQENGYATYGIISAAVLEKQFGLNQGFDVYDDVFDNEIKVTNVAERNGKETTEHALKWLSDNADRKKFMFIHYFDPHDEYDPPVPFSQQFRHPYDGEIAFTDNCIGRIIDKLKSLGLYKDSLIVIAGDHGEMLGEHSETGHSFFSYQNAIRVPLMFKLPGRPVTKSIKEPTSIIDVTPTILSVLDIPVPDVMQGVNLLQYKKKDFSLAGRPIYSESMTPTIYNANALMGIIMDRYHYIQTTRPELYDRIKDPVELNNLIEQEPQRARIMQDKLKEILENSVRTDVDASVELNDEMIKTLESLGYVSGSVDVDHSFDQTKDDPKDIIKIHNTLGLAQMLIHKEQYGQAIKLCDPIIIEHPKILKTYGLLAKAYSKMKMYNKAAVYMEKKLLLAPNDIIVMKKLSNIYVLNKDYDKAIEISNSILELDPNFSETYYILGNIYKHLKDIPKAMENYQKTLQLDPEHIQARINIAELKLLQGKLKDAIEQYELILKLDDNYILGHNSVAWLRATQKDTDFYDPELALIHAKKAAELSKYDDPEILDTLAVAQAANAQFDDAITTATKAVKLAQEKGKTDSAQRIQKTIEQYKQQKAASQ